MRGIGQIFTYEFFAEEKLSTKDYKYCDFADFSSVYIFPDSVLRNHDFNIGLFKYPQSSKILEVNSNSLAVRLIDKNELLRLKDSQNHKRKIISQYYIHDTRIFEMYFLMRILNLFKLKNKKVHRFELEKQLSHRLKTPNSGGWRNIFIALSTLGLINGQNIPNEKGAKLANLDYAEFACEIFKYFAPFFEAIFSVLKENTNLNLSQIFDKIIQNFNGEVSFLAEITDKHKDKNTRYISSYLNILRDDYAIFDFKPRDSKRRVLFDPFSAKESAFKKHIEKNSLYNAYKSDFERLINEL